MTRGTAPVLLPIETVNRELDYKLALASTMKAPNRCFIVYRRDLTPRLLEHVRGGLFVSQSAKYYARVQDRGTAILHLQEEGGIFPGRQEEWEHFLCLHYHSPEIALAGALLTWGSFQKDVVTRAWPERGAPVYATGHPRFDLCRAPWDQLYAGAAADLRSRFGDFVLVNTNFGLANHVAGAGAAFKDHDGYSKSDAKMRLHFVEMWRRSECGLAEMVSLLHRLAAEMPSTKFVLRPHPAENLEKYRGVTKDVQNIVVSHEGTVTPWLMAARVLVHNGCTTGLEARLCGTSVVAYMPSSVGEGEAWLPNALSRQTTTYQDARDAVREAMSGKAVHRDPPLGESELAAKIVRQLDPSTKVGAAMEEAASVATGLINGGGGVDENGLRLAALRHAARAEGSQLMALAKRLAARREPQPRKFGRLQGAALQRKLDALAKVTGKHLQARIFSPTCAVLS